MAEIRFPLGAPLASNPFPGAGGALDAELARQEAAIRRRRSPFEPPPEIGVTPQIVPRNMMRAAEAEDVRTRGQAMAVRHDGLDTAFNAQADSVREGLSGFRTAGDLLTVSHRIESMSRPNAKMVESLATSAIGAMRRTSASPQLWKPGPLPETDEAEPYLNHLSSVTQRAGWAYRGTPSGGDGNAPIVLEAGWMGKLKGVAGKVRSVGSDILDLPGRVLDVIPLRETLDIAQVASLPGLLTATVDQIFHKGEGAGQLQRSAQAIGSSFDGREFWRSVWVNGGAGIASGFGTTGDFEKYRLQAEESFEQHWAGLPRPVQLFAEELNPANVALAWAGGPLAGVLKQSGVRGARILGSMIAPLAENPLKAVGLQAATGVASRWAYEATEAATYLQFGIPFTGGLTESGKDVQVSPLRLGAALAAGGATLGAEQFLERGIARMTAQGARGGFTAELRQVVPDLPDNWTVAKPEAYEQLHRTPTMQHNMRAFDEASTGSPLTVTGFREDSGPRLPGTGVFYAADPSTAATYRKGGPGNLLAEPLEFHNPLVADSKEELLQAYSRSPDSLVSRPAQVLLEMQGGENVPHAEIDRFIAEQAQKQGRDAVVYRSPTDTRGGYPYNGSEVVDIRRDPTVTLMQLDGAREEVQGLQESLQAQMRALNDEAFAASEGMGSVTPEGIAETKRDLRFWLSEESRLTREAADLREPVAVGYPDAGGLSLPLKSALGDGGVIKAGNSDEMLSVITGEVMDDWRHGSTDLNASVFPVKFGLREGRPSGSKAIAIPDIVPVTRPATVRSFTHKPTLQAGGSLADTLTTASERAGDLAAQVNQTVPTGPMHSIARAEARLPSMGIASRAINWFNQASMDPVQRVASIAMTMTRGEMATRLAPSRAQFLGRLRDTFGSTSNLPARVQYIGDAERVLFGKLVPAADHPLTGTIVDRLLNPGNYDGDGTEFLADFFAYDARNSGVNQVLEDEFGVSIGSFDTGIGRGPVNSIAPGSTVNGRVVARTPLQGIFIPNYDAGPGPVARGATSGRSFGGSSLKEREFQTLADRLADPDQEGFEPVLDLAEIFTRLDDTKIKRAELETYRYAIGGSRTEVQGWREIGPIEIATGEKVWLPPEQAEAAANWLTAKESGLANWFEDLKNTRLGGDMSPLTIQGSMGWALSPVSTARDVVEGMGRGMLQGNPLRPMTNEAMFEDIAAAPERWMRFFSYMGASPAGGTPREWRSGWLETLPQWFGEKIGTVSPALGRAAAAPGAAIHNLNDSVTNALTRGMESTFNEFGTMLLQRGVPEDEAWGAAADVMKMGWLQQNFDQLGIGSTRRSVERGVLTSTTFIRQPVAFMAQAATGYAKLAASPARLFGTAGQWTELTSREVLAVHAFTRMAGTFTGIAAVSAALTAEERGWTPEEAIERAILDVRSPDWMTLWLTKDIKVPIGGPFRGLARAVAPQEFLGHEHVPFGGMFNFFHSRITTGGQLIEDAAQNEDFYGNKIVTEQGVKGLGQALAYAAANVVPVMAGVPYQTQRAGQPFSAGVREIAFQYLGQNPLQASQYEVLERERRIGGRAVFDAGYEGRIALGLTPEQAKVEAPSLERLRNAIGTRAANAAAELGNPNVAGARDAYVKDLRRRAALDDVDAQALLVSIDTQVELAALARTKQVDGALDKTAYRNARGPVIDRLIGRSDAYNEVFEKMRRSDSPIDRASAEYQALYDKAAITVEMDGRPIVVGTDYEALEKMQQQLLGSLDPTVARLVEQNVAVAPLGAAAPEVELRRVQGDLRDSGFWRIDDELWAKGKPGLVASKVVPVEAMGAVENAATFTEYRSIVVEGLTRELVKGGFQPETAIQFAKSRFDARPEAQDWGSAMIERKVKWAEQHVDDGLAELAIQWGFLSDSFKNLDAAGVDEGNRERREAAKAQPPPQSRAIEDVTNERLRTEHDGGLSYSQLATKYGITRDAAIGRVRRAGEA